MDTIRTPEKRIEFLGALAACGNVTEACRTIAVARNTMYLWKSQDADFAAEWDRFLVMGAEILEDEAIRRAREGYDEPVFYKGEMTGTIRKYSDTLLIFLLKGAMPTKYRENIDMTSKGEQIGRVLVDL